MTNVDTTDLVLNLRNTPAFEQFAPYTSSRFYTNLHILKAFDRAAKHTAD